VCVCVCSSVCVHVCACVFVSLPVRACPKVLALLFIHGLTPRVLVWGVYLCGREIFAVCARARVCVWGLSVAMHEDC
jgi:hypothetical protein